MELFPLFEHLLCARQNQPFANSGGHHSLVTTISCESPQLCRLAALGPDLALFDLISFLQRLYGLCGHLSILQMGKGAQRS